MLRATEHAAGGDGSAVHALVELGQCREDAAEALRMLLLDHGLPLDRHVQRLFDLTPESDLAGQGPWLVRLPGPPPATLLQGLAQLAGVRHALSLIASSLPPSQLASHLKSWSQGMVPADPSVAGDEDRGAVVRWYDPRIGFDLVACLPEAERRQFLCAVHWWAGWQVDFAPRVLPGTAACRSAPRELPLLLDASLAMAFDRLNTPEAMLALIHENDIEPGELDPIAPALQRWLAHKLLDDARRSGLSTWDDQYMLLAVGLRLHPDAASLAALQPLVQAAAAGSCPLTASVPAMQPSQWAEWAAQAPQALQRRAHELLALIRTRQSAPPKQRPFAALPHFSIPR